MNRLGDHYSFCTAGITSSPSAESAPPPEPERNQTTVSSAADQSAVESDALITG